jgi:catechol 2,3-dioxygenase-like lactoylglutathione lyase family enzyme
MTYQLHHIHLLCSNLELMINFFTEILGSKLVERKKFGGADGATLDLQGTLINLRIARENEIVNEDTFEPSYGLNHIGLETGDVEGNYEALKGKGFEFITPPRDAGKNRIAFFKGPDNLIIELLQPL